MGKYVYLSYQIDIFFLFSRALLFPSLKTYAVEIEVLLLLLLPILHVFPVYHTHSLDTPVHCPTSAGTPPGSGSAAPHTETVAVA